MAGHVGTAVRLLLRRRRARVALLALAIALPTLAAGWLWFRSSPFVSVRRVQIVGVSGPDAQAVEQALSQAAHGMSTLAVSEGALRAAVAPLRVVQSLRVVPRFPHGLVIEVVEQLPVATLTVGGQRTALAADGVALGPALASGSLPGVNARVLPVAGHRVGEASLLAELTVLGAAPPALAAHVERAFVGARGLTLAMRNGLLVYFGDASRPHAKWLSLARVLADPSSAGAVYIDVRLPSHPAAGFPAGVTPPYAAAGGANGTGEQAAGERTAGEQAAGVESTVAALAAALPGGGASSSSAASEPASSATAAAPSGAASEASASGQGGAQPSGSEAPSGAGTQAPSGAGAGAATGAAPTGAQAAAGG